MIDGEFRGLEALKHNYEDFGGIQSFLLPQPMIEQRICCARSCPHSGFVQVQIPLETPEQYRVLCKSHYVLTCMMTAAALGDPAPAEEAKRVAEAINMDWSTFLRVVEPKHAVQPENFICMKCGGAMVPETVGMYSGKRWVHTCGVSNSNRQVTE